METGYVFRLLPCYQAPTLILRREAGQGGCLWLHVHAAVLSMVLWFRLTHEEQERGPAQNMFYGSVMFKCVQCLRGGGRKKAMPKEEWLCWTQPQVIHNGRELAFWDKILWHMSEKEAGKKFGDTGIKSRRVWSWEHRPVTCTAALWSRMSDEPNQRLNALRLAQASPRQPDSWAGSSSDSFLNCKGRAKVSIQNSGWGRGRFSQRLTELNLQGPTLWPLPSSST